jgi:hypothetical protein
MGVGPPRIQIDRRVAKTETKLNLADGSQNHEGYMEPACLRRRSSRYGPQMTTAWPG